MKRVLARSIFFSTLRICAGSVESRMCSAENRRSAVGQREHFGTEAGSSHASRRMSENAPPCTSSAKAFNLAAWESCSSVMPSHPSQLASSSPVQSEASPCRAVLLFPRRASRQGFFLRGVKIGGKEAFCAFVCDVVVRFVFFSTAASSVSKASANSFTPSASACRSHLS